MKKSWHSVLFGCSPNTSHVPSEILYFPRLPKFTHTSTLPMLPSDVSCCRLPTIPPDFSCPWVPQCLELNLIGQKPVGTLRKFQNKYFVCWLMTIFLYSTKCTAASLRRFGPLKTAVPRFAWGLAPIIYRCNYRTDKDRGHVQSWFKDTEIHIK